MGCFDTADGISGLTIKHGDKCGLVLLTPESSYPNTTGDGGTTILNPSTSLPGGGPTETFAPYCLPIWGEYNDYGSLEEIVKDTTVLGLEKYFETTIENILSIIGSGRSIFDSYSSVHSTYGTGLSVDYSKPPTEVWMLEAGFRKITTDDKALHKLIIGLNKDKKGPTDKKGNAKKINAEEIWILSGVRECSTWDGKAWKSIGIPVCWFQLTKEAVFDKPETVCRTYYTRSSGYEGTHNWENTYDRSQKDFAESVMKYTKYGFLGTGTGIQLGVKKEFYDRVLELKELSGMFIDAKLFNAVTEKSATTTSKRRDTMLDNTYPSKHMMPLLGFKYVQMVSGEDPTKEVKDDGLPLPDRSDKPNLLVYTHEAAPDYYFVVEDCDDNMSVDLYDKNMKDLDRGKGLNGERYSVSSFSPLGVQTLIEVVTGGRDKGTKIEIDHLLDLPDNHFFYAKMKDYMKRRKTQYAEVLKWEKETAYIKDLSDDEKKKLHESRTEEETAYFIKMIRVSHRMDTMTRDDSHRVGASIGFYAKFKMGFAIYSSDMVKQTKWFVNATDRWKRFISTMYATNKIFMPAAHHCQHGEYDGQIKLAKTIAKVALDKHVARDEDYDYSTETYKSEMYRDILSIVESVADAPSVAHDLEQLFLARLNVVENQTT